MAQPFCSKCGNPVRPDQEYCLACGATIEHEPRELKPIHTSDEVSVSSASAGASPQTLGRSNKRYVLYGLAVVICLGIVVYAVLGASWNPLSLLGLTPSHNATSAANHTATVPQGNTPSASPQSAAQQQVVVVNRVQPTQTLVTPTVTLPPPTITPPTPTITPRTADAIVA